MIKLTATITLLLLFGGVHALTITPTIGPSDTIGYCTSICLDSTVVSFRISVITGSIATERICLGSCYFFLAPVQHHSTVIVSEIISTPKPGVTMRLPSRVYYVR